MRDEGDAVGSNTKRRPRLGTVALGFPGYYLGEEMATAKYGEMLKHLGHQELDLVPVGEVVLDGEAARRAGKELAAADVDLMCAVLTTFVPDHYIVELLKDCDLPIFLWAIEREIGCLSLVGGMLINPTLYELGRPHQLCGADVGDMDTTEALLAYARASMLRRALREMRVGYIGGNPDIMFSMAPDLYGLNRTMGVTVVPLRDFEYTRRRATISDEEARADWEIVVRAVGRVNVSETDALAASKAFLALRQIAEEGGLDALSVNCWPDLKSIICLPIARLNDLGISAACEGDLYSTILMRLLYILAGRSAGNGDFLRMYADTNAIMFSHCGAGALSLARSPEDIVLSESVETHDGLAVFFPADQPGTITAVNLMGSQGRFRMAAMVGEVEPTDMSYQGTPMRVRFDRPVQEILQAAVRCGAGHHWNLGYGDYGPEFSLLCELLGIEYNLLS